jgi:hypothetical protein
VGDFLLVALFLGLVLWVGWPVTLWAGSAAVLAWAARLRVARTTKASEGGAAASTLAVALADTLVGVALGVGLVWVAQVALMAIGSFAGSGPVRSAEVLMSTARTSLGLALHPAVFVGWTVLGLLVATRAPRPRPSTTARTRRPRLSPSSMIALVGSLFFFAGLAARCGEPRWVASRQTDAGNDLRALQAAQADLLAMAEIQRDLPRLPADERSYLASFLLASQSQKHQSAIVDEKAARLAAHARVTLPALADGLDAQWASVQRCGAWLYAPDRAGTGAPSLDDLGTLERTMREVRGREVDAMAEAKKAAALAMASSAPSVPGPQLDAFVGALVGAFAEKWTGHALGSAVQDLPSAARLLDAVEHGRLEPWRVRASDDVEGSGGGSTASAAAEVQALERGFELREADPDAPGWSAPLAATPEATADE